MTAKDAIIFLSGTGTLESGQAIINFEQVEASFNDVISTVAPIRVTVTPNGPVALYVSEKSNIGFKVVEINGLSSGITFDWMVTAYRKDYEPAAVVEIVVPVETGDSVVVEEPIADETTPVVVEETVPVVEEVVPVVEETTPVAVEEPVVDEITPIVTIEEPVVDVTAEEIIPAP